MRIGSAALSAFTVVSLLASTTSNAVPITIGFLAEVGRVHSAPFDVGIDRGDMVRGTWTYDSDAIGEAVLGGGTTYLSTGPMYQLRIEGGDGWPAFVYDEGIRITIRNNVDMGFSAIEPRCRSGDRIADVYQASTRRGGVERFFFMFLNCSALAYSSEALPSGPPRLGPGLFEFLPGQSESAVILDFRPIGGPQTLLTFKDVFLVPEPSSLLLVLFATMGLLIVPHTRGLGLGAPIVIERLLGMLRALPAAVGIAGHVSLDRSGEWYGGFGPSVGRSATFVSGSMTGNWMLQTTTPTGAELQSYLTGPGYTSVGRRLSV